MDELSEPTTANKTKDPEITLDLIKKRFSEAEQIND